MLAETNTLSTVPTPSFTQAAQASLEKALAQMETMDDEALRDAIVYGPTYLKNQVYLRHFLLGIRVAELLGEKDQPQEACRRHAAGHIKAETVWQDNPTHPAFFVEIGAIPATACNNEGWVFKCITPNFPTPWVGRDGKAFNVEPAVEAFASRLDAMLASIPCMEKMTQQFSDYPEAGGSFAEFAATLETDLVTALPPEMPAHLSEMAESVKLDIKQIHAHEISKLELTRQQMTLALRIGLRLIWIREVEDPECLLTMQAIVDSLELIDQATISVSLRSCQRYISLADRFLSERKLALESPEVKQFLETPLPRLMSGEHGIEPEETTTARQLCFDFIGAAESLNDLYRRKRVAGAPKAPPPGKGTERDLNEERRHQAIKSAATLQTIRNGTMWAAMKDEELVHFFELLQALADEIEPALKKRQAPSALSERGKRGATARMAVDLRPGHAEERVSVDTMAKELFPEEFEESAPASDAPQVKEDGMEFI